MRDTTADSEGEEKHKTSILSSYMVDENGDQVPEHEKTAVRDVTREFFFELLEKGRAPNSWRRVAGDCKKELFYQLETQFEFLRYCNNHWKANMVPTNSYSQWRGNYVKNPAEKTRPIDVDAPAPIDVDTITPPGGRNNPRSISKASKRRREEDKVPGPSKRSRVEETGPTEVIQEYIVRFDADNVRAGFIVRANSNGMYKEAATNSPNPVRTSNSDQMLR